MSTTDRLLAWWDRLWAAPEPSRTRIVLAARGAAAWATNCRRGGSCLPWDALYRRAFDWLLYHEGSPPDALWQTPKESTAIVSATGPEESDAAVLRDE